MRIAANIVFLLGTRSKMKCSVRTNRNDWVRSKIMLRWAFTTTFSEKREKGVVLLHFLLHIIATVVGLVWSAQG
jgi:hypothetical protein